MTAPPRGDSSSRIPRPTGEGATSEEATLRRTPAAGQARARRVPGADDQPGRSDPQGRVRRVPTGDAADRRRGRGTGEEPPAARRRGVEGREARARERAADAEGKASGTRRARRGDGAGAEGETSRARRLDRAERGDGERRVGRRVTPRDGVEDAAVRRARPRRTGTDTPDERRGRAPWSEAAETLPSTGRTRRLGRGERGSRGRDGRRPRSTSATTGADAPAKPARQERADRPARTGGRLRSAAAERAHTRRARRDGSAERAKAATEETTGGRASFVVSIIALLVVGVAATLWLTTQAIADSYRLEEAKQEANRLAEQAAVLQREVAKQESAPALAQRARELGMVPAGDPARLVTRPDGSVVIVGEPTPVQSPTAPQGATNNAPASAGQPGGGGG